VDSLAGHLLVASPYLEDPNFAHTVVLLIHHNAQGAFGVVLNRPAENTIKDLWEQVAESSCTSEGYVRVGGPVSGPLIALHTDSDLSEIEILPGLYFAAQRERLEKLVNQNAHPFRLFVGHSGWGGGQLERELKEGSWLTIQASVEFVFLDDYDLWKRAAQQVGERLLMKMLRLKRPPTDPSLN
jgi:putative transcriptional regulator